MAQSVNLGETPKDNDIRDALHIAVISGIAGEKLKAGQNIRLSNGVWISCNISVSTAVVDPYIKKPLKAGDLFWACLLPNTVTDVRHVWTHPDFPVKMKAKISGSEFTPEESQRWIRDYCATANCPGYDEVVSAALGEMIEDYGYGNGYQIDDEYLLFLGRDAGGEIPNELWDHIENATGKKCIWRPKYFSCSC